MRDAVPEAVFPEDDSYPSYRMPMPIKTARPKRLPIDEYVLTAIVSAGTDLYQPKFERRSTEL